MRLADWEQPCRPCTLVLLELDGDLRDLGRYNRSVMAVMLCCFLF
jgi:predicted dithiol-disulfide oxidoreductase (DUF899 family)